VIAVRVTLSSRGARVERDRRNRCDRLSVIASSLTAAGRCLATRATGRIEVALLDGETLM
jgi:hypothetical protein